MSYLCKFQLIGKVRLDPFPPATCTYAKIFSLCRCCPQACRRCRRRRCSAKTKTKNKTTRLHKSPSADSHHSRYCVRGWRGGGGRRSVTGLPVANTVTRSATAVPCVNTPGVRYSVARATDTASEQIYRTPRGSFTIVYGTRRRTSAADERRSIAVFTVLALPAKPRVNT